MTLDIARTSSDSISDHVADHNTLHDRHNELGGVGAQIPASFLANAVESGRIVDVTSDDYGAKGDGSTDDLAAIQGAIDYAREFGGWVYFPHFTAAGGLRQYMVSAPIKAYSGTRMLGPAIIKAKTGFDFSANSNTAVLELYSDNDTRYGLGRLFLKDLWVDGGDIDGSRCILANIQQQSLWDTVRANGFKDTGIILNGQQAQFIETMIIGAGGAHDGVGLLLESGCKFMSFFGFNAEKMEVGVHHDADGPNWFDSVHFEPNHTNHPNAVGFDIDRGGVIIRNGWASMEATTQTLIRAGNSGGQASSYYYKVEDFRLSSTADLKAIDDTARGIELLGWTDFRRNITYFEAPRIETSATYTQPYIWSMWGDDGRRVLLGGMEPADPSAVWQAGTSQTADLAQWNDSGGTKRFSIDDTAHPVLPAYTDAGRPSASGVPAGTTIFNTDDNFVNVSDGTNWRDPTGATT